MERIESKESVSVLWRGNKFVVEINTGTTLREFGDELHKLTEVKADTMRFIVPQSSNGSSKLFSPFSDEQSSLSLHELGIVEGKFIRMMGVSETELEEVLQNAKKDFRIAGFDEEEKRRRQLVSRGPHSSLRLPQGPYIFCDFRTLQIPGVELNPPPSEALKRMHMLAADTGIVAIMNKHRWRVGIMTELAPVGYVGVSPKCVLGYNKNHGEEISLRLRTDDLKGFRKYESIKKTLLHELAHMVHSEHDANFYALDKQLNREAASLDWTRSRSHTLSGFGHSDHLDESVDDSDNIDFSHKLGGSLLEPQFSARESSVAAAYRRLANTSGNSSEVSEVSEGPDPDDTGYGESDIINTPQTNVNSESAKEVQHCHGPANAGFVNGSYFEPDPDDSQGGQTFQSEQFTKIDGKDLLCSPSSVVFDMSLFVPSLTNNHNLAASRTCEEPDSDDVEDAVVGRSDSHNNQEVEVLDSRMPSNRHIDETDPDDSQPEKKILEHGNIVELKECESLLNISLQCQGDLGHKYKDMNAGYSEANQYMQSEPDPDDNLTQQQEIKEINMNEPDPDDNLTHQQEMKEMDMSEPDPDDQELQRIQDPVTDFCRRLQRAIQILRSEVNPMEVTIVLQTLFTIIRNVIDNPNNIKFKRLRKANPAFQRTVAKYKAAMEILFLIGFNEDVAWDEIGKAETYLILKRNDPGLLWLAKSSLEACVSC